MPMTAASTSRLNTVMKANEPGPSPDPCRITVDGEEFEVEDDAAQPGVHHYTRLTGPAPGSGFTIRRSDHRRSTETLQHEARIRAYLDLVDPSTGYIDDDPDDDG
jgi:hypothetical protein